MHLAELYAHHTLCLESQAPTGLDALIVPCALCLDSLASVVLDAGLPQTISRRKVGRCLVLGAVKNSPWSLATLTQFVLFDRSGTNWQLFTHKLEHSFWVLSYLLFSWSAATHYSFSSSYVCNRFLNSFSSFKKFTSLTRYNQDWIPVCQGWTWFNEIGFLSSSLHLNYMDI